MRKILLTAVVFALSCSLAVALPVQKKQSSGSKVLEMDQLPAEVDSSALLQFISSLGPDRQLLIRELNLSQQQQERLVALGLRAYNAYQMGQPVDYHQVAGQAWRYLDPDQQATIQRLARDPKWKNRAQEFVKLLPPSNR